MTGEQQFLLAAIDTVPDDWTARLVYADWLDEHSFAEEAAFIRAFNPASPDVRITGDQFHAAVIAQDDDNDYSESGYFAAVFAFAGVDVAVIGQYAHCSCYDTWASICGGGISDYFAGDSIQQPRFNWIGSVPALLDMARRVADPSLPQRAAVTEDSDYDHLIAMYTQVIAYFEGKNPVWPCFSCGPVGPCVCCIAKSNMLR